MKVDDVTLIVGFCIVSSALSAIICCYARALGRATKLVDHPDGMLKLHSGETPLVGGIALFVPTLALSFAYFGQFFSAPFMLLALCATTLMFIIGVADDRFRLSPSWRLIGLTLIVFAVFAIDPLFVLRALRFGIRSADFGISLGVFAAPITALMVVGFVNAANMADGINGQLMGSVAIWSLLIARYLGLDLGMPFYLISCSAIVVLAFNLRGRLFSGSSGAYTASFLIALGAITAYRRGGAVSAVEPILWFWLPTVDCVRLMANRLIAAKSPFHGDRNHIHHILQEYFGVGSPYVLMGYLALLAAPGISAAITNDRFSGALTLVACIAVYTALVCARPGADAIASVKKGREVPSSLPVVNSLRQPGVTPASRHTERRKLTTQDSG